MPPSSWAHHGHLLFEPGPRPATFAQVVIVFAHLHEPVPTPLVLQGEPLGEEPGQVPQSDADGEGIEGGHGQGASMRSAGIERSSGQPKIQAPRTAADVSFGSWGLTP